MAEELKQPTKCRECGGSSLSWFADRQNNSGVQDGRLRMHDVRSIFVLGCDDCSATLAVVSADKIADHLNTRAQLPSQGGEAVEVEYPTYHAQGMGCGLEDRGITDRYEAMAYGFQEAVDQMAAIIDSMGPLYTHPSDQSEDDLAMVSRELPEQIAVELEQDYARLEQECERWKETAAGLDRQNDAIADELAAALTLLARYQEHLDPHRDAVLWGEVCDALGMKP